MNLFTIHNLKWDHDEHVKKDGKVYNAWCQSARNQCNSTWQNYEDLDVNRACDGFNVWAISPCASAFLEMSGFHIHYHTLYALPQVHHALSILHVCKEKACVGWMLMISVLNITLQLHLCTSSIFRCTPWHMHYTLYDYELNISFCYILGV